MSSFRIKCPAASNRLKVGLDDPVGGEGVTRQPLKVPSNTNYSMKVKKKKKVLGQSLRFYHAVSECM